MTLVVLYLITVLISYFLVREGVKKQVKTSALVLEELIILIVSVLIPILNLVISVKSLIELNKNTGERLSKIIENFFLIK